MMDKVDAKFVEHLCGGGSACAMNGIEYHFRFKITDGITVDVVED